MKTKTEISNIVTEVTEILTENNFKLVRSIDETDLIFEYDIESLNGNKNESLALSLAGKKNQILYTSTIRRLCKLDLKWFAYLNSDNILTIILYLPNHNIYKF